MDKATSTLRRSGAFLLSFGTGHQELNLIISDLKSLKSQLKAVRDSQQTVLQDITNWTCVDENRTMQELFLHLSDLNELWSEVQTNFADQLSEFRHQFETILEGERNLDALRSKVTSSEAHEEKAKKKLKKAEKKQGQEEIRAAKLKITECERQKELLHAEVTERVKENEAVKLIIIKSGLLKLSQAYLALSQKCIYIFEAQRDIVNSLPDLEGKDISEITFDGFSGAKDILQRARTAVKDYRILNQSSSSSVNPDPPPPYSLSPQFVNSPYNPYFVNSPSNSYLSSPTEQSDSTSRRDGPSGLYPNAKNDEELAEAMKKPTFGFKF